jgi:hypothetical protein
MIYPKFFLSFIAGALCAIALLASEPYEAVLGLLLVMLAASVGANLLQAYCGRQQVREIGRLLQLRDQQSALLRRAMDLQDAYELASGQQRGGADATR